MELKYRADIDGLRAIAVLVVIMFHVGIPGFSGGFVGVDVFFVISGFLITTIILNEIKEGKFSIARFYERRIRRIFPALFPVIIFTFLVGFYLFDFVSFKELGESIIGTTLFYSNILFWLQAGYFDVTSIRKPLLHTWSLAVEEQFYIFFPLLLLSINRFGKNSYLPWLLGIGLLSLFSSIYGIYTHPSVTFFLVPSRAWELLAGSILALEVIPVLTSNLQRTLFGFAGFCLICYSVAFYTEATLFPGANALVPVIGSSMIIYSGMDGHSIMSKLLRFKPLVYIGLISYPLYLWHWPIIVFAKYLIFRELNFLEISIIIIITFIISALSLKFVERPFRGIQPIIPNRKKLFAFSGVLMFFASMIGVVIYVQDGMRWRYLETNNVVESGIWEWYQNSIYGKLEQLSNNLQPGKCGIVLTKPSFLLWGDSHAMALVPGFDKNAKKYGLSGFILTHSSCPPLLGIDDSNSPYDEPEFNNNVIIFIKAHPEIKTVILAAAWSQYDRLNEREKEVYTDASFLFKKGLYKTVNVLLSLNRKVILVTDIPYLKNYESPRIFYLKLRFPKYYSVPESISPTFAEYMKMNNSTRLIFNEIENSLKITIIHPELMLFDNNGRGLYQLNNIPLYRNTDHLSTYGSYVVSQAFDQVFKNMSLPQ